MPPSQPHRLEYSQTEHVHIRMPATGSSDAVLLPPAGTTALTQRRPNSQEESGSEPSPASLGASLAPPAWPLGEVGGSLSPAGARARPLLPELWALAPICFSSVDDDSRACGTGLGVLLCGESTLSPETASG